MKSSYNNLLISQINAEGWATHLPVLCEILSLLECKKMAVLEFGPGKYSTDLFTRNCGYTYSIDCQDETRHRELLAAIGQRPGFESVCASHPLAELSFIPCINRKFDLVFIDSNHTCRFIVAQCAMLYKWSSIIVCHDSEEKLYKYESIVMPLGWECLEIRDMACWTLVFCALDGFLDDLKEPFTKTQRYSIDGLKYKPHLR